jgi:hypothetical protein
MPRPESWTATRTPPRAGSTVTVTLPPISVNLTAFDNRLLKICEIRRASARMTGSAGAVGAGNFNPPPATTFHALPVLVSRGRYPFLESREFRRRLPINDKNKDTTPFVPAQTFANSTQTYCDATIGDTTGDKTVNGSDVTQTRGQVGKSVTGANFREDVTVDGAITFADVRLVRSDVGHTLP